MPLHNLSISASEMTFGFQTLENNAGLSLFLEELLSLCNDFEDDTLLDLP